ncbi:hypothetical protein QBC37DRAFT_249730, partial [Rhypophila decipiens]
IYKLCEAIAQQSREQYENYTVKLAKEAILIRQEFLSRRFLTDVTPRLCYTALKLINNAYRVALSTFPTKKHPVPSTLPPCDDECTYTLQFGVPCCHEIVTLLNDDERLKLSEVHHRWHLRLRMDENDYYLRLQNPDRIANTRARPK